MCRFRAIFRSMRDRLFGIQGLKNDLEKVIEVQNAALHNHLHNIKQTINLVARNEFIYKKNAIRVLFLVHHIEAFDRLIDIYNIMKEDDDFTTIVASIPRKFPGANDYKHEYKVHDGLEKLGIQHIRLAFDDSFIGLDIIKALEPDVIFIQSPWEQDIPPAYRIHELSFSRVCYIPYYGLTLINEFEPGQHIDFHVDQNFHRLCWRIFCDSILTKELFKQKCSRGDQHCLFFGHPKLDRMFKARNEMPVWPIKRHSAVDYQNGKKTFRLIWAPHHSVGDSWLRFGTFPKIYKEMLAWAREDSNIEILLKPHPALFDVLLSGGYVGKDDFRQWLDCWNKLPNTGIAEGTGYREVFIASDAMLTDGVSFLVEYPIATGKPLIFFDSGKHAVFNANGKIAENYSHKVTSFSEVVSICERIRRGEVFPKLREEKMLLDCALPYPGKAALKIVESIRESLRYNGEYISCNRDIQPTE